MGRRGPKPKPLNELKLAGTYRRDKHGLVPEPEGGEMTPPEWMHPDLRQYWPDLVALLKQAGAESPYYTLPLMLMADALHDFLRAQKEAATMPMATESANGNRLHEPLQSVKSNVAGRLMKLLVEFGMTPSAIRNIQKVEKHEVDALQELLNRRNG